MSGSLWARKADDKMQALSDHLRNVGDIAAAFESRDEAISMLAGRIHDIGKASHAFQRYLVEDVGEKGSVVHARQGAFVIHDLCDGKTGLADRLASQVMELSVASHHRGLPDMISKDGMSSFQDRMGDSGDERYHFDEIMRSLPLLDPRIKILFQRAVTDVDTFLDHLMKAGKEHGLGQASVYYYFGLYVKYVYSRLVDADRLDAAEFASGRSLRGPQADWAELGARLESYLNGMDSADPIGQMRRKIGGACLAAAERPTGIYRLSVPTGGGKTLSSLGYAIRHAQLTGKRRIIYVSPYLSVTGQTAATFRRTLNLEEDDGTLLEHHSAVIPPQDERKSEAFRLSTERWDNPIIVTTMVRFLETAMSSRGTDLRRLHNMADSVIIFDEIQQLPIESVNLFNETVGFLSLILGSTIVLCTATQPPLERSKRDNIPLADRPELVDIPENDRNAFKRTRLVVSTEEKSLDELSDFILDRARDNGNCLAVVNLKAEARRIHQRLTETIGDGEFLLVHLSTTMCPAHRADRLRQVRKALDEGRPVICVSTQLIEAGVDISFGCVVRAMAGLDSIMQAAGRCNRNGESKEPRDVYVFPIRDERGLRRLPSIKKTKELTMSIALSHGCKDMDSPEVLAEYFNNKFDLEQPLMDGGRKSGNMYRMLAENKEAKARYHTGTKREYAWPIAQSFETAGRQYHALDASNRTPVIAPYGDALDLLDRLERLRSDDIAGRIAVTRALQQYTVNLFDCDLRTLTEIGAVYRSSGEDSPLVLAEANYDSEYGVTADTRPEFLDF